MTWTANDIPDLTGRTAVVTGANSGLGLEASRALAGKGATVYLAVRNPDKGATAIEDILREYPNADLHLQQVDLSSLDSIRTAAGELKDRVGSIDLLLNNAAAMYTSRKETADGFGMQMSLRSSAHCPTGWSSVIGKLKSRTRPMAARSWRISCSPSSCSAVSVLPGPRPLRLPLTPGFRPQRCSLIFRACGSCNRS